jgi:hypothetical protein
MVIVVPAHAGTYAAASRQSEEHLESSWAINSATVVTVRMRLPAIFSNPINLFLPVQSSAEK